MELIPFDKIQYEIATAKDIQTLSLLSDKIQAIQILAKQSHQSIECQNEIAEYRIKIDRKRGNWFQENIPKHNEKNGSNKVTRLKDINITKNESSKLQKLAKINEKEINKICDDIKQKDDIITNNRILKQIKKDNRQNEIGKLRENIEKENLIIPKGLYDVIVIDPPWDYGNSQDYDSEFFRGTIPYPAMSIDNIKNIKIPAKDNCILWLWITVKFMRYFPEIIDKWGFREVSILTWVKNRFGVGKWLRSQTEYCIMSVKGKPKINLTNQSTVLQADMREHSRKPDGFYKLVDSLCFGRKLDYFSREKRAGWEQYGKNEF